MTTTRSLVIEKVLPHPQESIWRALTQGPLIKEWLMDNEGYWITTALLAFDIGCGGVAQLVHAQGNVEGYAPPCRHRAGWRNEG